MTLANGAALGNTQQSDRETVIIKAPTAAPGTLTDDPPSDVAKGSGRFVFHIYSDAWVLWEDDVTTGAWQIVNSVAAV